MKPAALLREARRAGISFSTQDGAVCLAAVTQPSPDLIAALREHKGDVIAILSGNACRWCGEQLAWPRPVGVTFADGTAECHACADAEIERLWLAAERVVASPDALADPAEVVLRGEIE
jgi:hypothetical protein